jgi:uncharacterized protein YqkB
MKLSKNTFSLSATNPKITGNIKVLIENESDFYLESIESTEELSSSSFKKFSIDKGKRFRSNVKNFCDTITTESLFSVKSEEFVIGDNLSNQNSKIYRFGAYSDTEKSLDETHRFFAPIFIHQSIPDVFVIAKIQRNEFGDINVVNNDNLDIVKIYDLTPDTDLGVFLYEHLQDIEKEMGISVNYDTEVSVTGIDVRKGVISEKGVYDSNELLLERSISESENFLLNSYKKSESIDPRFLNLEFAFTFEDDSEINDSFIEIIGFYATKNEILSTALAPSTNINIAKTTEYVQTDVPIVTSSPIYEPVGTINVASAGIPKAPSLRIPFSTIPNINQNLSFSDGASVISITIDDDIRKTTIEETIDAVIEEFNTVMINTAETFIIEFTRIGKVLIATASLTSLLQEGIEVTELPLGVSVEPPFIGAFNGATPHLLGIDKKGLVLLTKNITTDIDAVEFVDGTIALPTQGFTYKDLYVYKTNVSTEGLNVVGIKLLKEVPVKYYTLSILEHRKIDYDRSSSYHADPLDFNLNLYKNYLVSQVNDPSFLGRLVAPTPSELADYKVEVLEIIDRYFDSVSIGTRQMLVDEIDKNNFTFTTTDNEYKPLNENNNISLAQNSINPFVGKFSIRDGFDVTNAPLRFNTSMTFKDNNFTPSHIKPRDLRDFTHSWYLIGSGLPPWYSEMDGYTAVAISSTDILDTVVDVYDNIPESSIVKKDLNSKITSTFFRGARVILDEKYDGWRFTSVLLPQEAPVGKDVEFVLLENSTFKTITFAVKQFIPEPVLTGLEVPSDYNLDRSLLYFSQGGNSTIVSLSSLGEEPISLILFDNTTTKIYNGQNVGTEWIYNDNGIDLAHVSLNTAVNNLDLTTMLFVGSNFEISYGDINPLSTVTFGILIIFEDVVEVTPTTFWCKRIDVTLKETDAFLVTTIYNFEIVADYVADDTILFNDNKYAVTESIARYNAVFDRTISNNLGGNRYNTISFANIKGVSNSNLTKLINIDLDESLEPFRVANQDEVFIQDSLTYDYSKYSLGRASSVHRFSVNRQSFYYDIITRVLIQSQTDNINVLHQDFEYAKKCSSTIQNLNRYIDLNVENSEIPIYLKNYGDYVVENSFQYNTNHKDFQNVHFLYSPSEQRGLVSNILNTTTELIVEVPFVNGVFSLTDALFLYANSVLGKSGLQDFVFGNLESFSLFLDSLELEQDKVKEITVNRFIENELMGVIQIKEITVDGVKYDSVLIDKKYVKILTLDLVSGNCTLTFTRR